MLWNIAINDAGAEYDPLTLLRSRTMFGRPDWSGIYKQMRMAIEAGQYIPGSNSQLKTTVGVSLWSGSFCGTLTCSRNDAIFNVDILLWSERPREGDQGGHRRTHMLKCELHVRKGTLRALLSPTSPSHR